METFRLGKTNLTITRTGFGVLPLQRTPMPEAVRILRRAYEAGITFYDTARAYTDSEEKIGQALADVRDRVVLATKSGATTRDGVWHDLETSLKALRTSYIDVFQLHNPGELSDPDNPASSYAALREAQAQGLIRHIGLTNHRLDVARRAATSGQYATVQFPLSALSDPKDLKLIDLCRQHDVGVIAMKPLCGGLLTDIPAAFAALRQYANLVPIWGIQRLAELEELLALDAQPPAFDAGLRRRVAALKGQLGSNFCRACGYCLPCPAEIPLPMAARMSLLLRRMPTAGLLTEDWHKQMLRIRDCQHCGKCHERCPYGIDPAALLPAMLADYEEFYLKAQAPSIRQKENPK